MPTIARWSSSRRPPSSGWPKAKTPRFDSRRFCSRRSARRRASCCVLAALLAFGYLLFETLRLETVARHRMYVVLILIFFCMLFWAFFEQAGSSINNFTDRNVDRVLDRGDDPNHHAVRRRARRSRSSRRKNNSATTTASSCSRSTSSTKLRKSTMKHPTFKIDWKVADDNVGMRVARRADEIPASLFQAVNPIYILLFGLVFTALWTFLGTHGAGAEHAAEVRPGTAATGAGVRRLLVWHPDGRRPRHGRRALAAAGLSAAHDRRTCASRRSGCR